MTFRSNKITPQHHPWCGYWWKTTSGGPPIPPVGGEFTFDSYFELLDPQPATPSFDATLHTYLYGMQTFNKVSPDRYDGVTSWEFEVVAMNDYAFDMILEVVDTSYAVCATVTIAAGTVGATGYELFRSRVPFTPTADDTYGLKVSIAGLHLGDDVLSFPVNCMITTARLIAHQVGATKTQLQIPMFYLGFNRYDLVEYGLVPDIHPLQPRWPWDCPVGWAISPMLATWQSSFNTRWTYNTSEIGTSSEVMLSAYSESPWSKPTTKTISFFAAVPYTTINHVLYWAADGSNTLPVPQGGATPDFWVDETQVYVDDLDASVYTPIPDSYVNFVGNPAHPFSETVTPDFSGLSGTLQFYLGYQINLVNLWGTNGEWFEVTIGPGKELQATITFASTDSTHYTATIEYSIVFVGGLAPFDVALMDMDTSTVVTDSTLTWVEAEGQSRKYSIPLSLTDGHTYEIVVRWDSPSVAGMGWVYAPSLMDAQLLIKLDPIVKLTIWLRVGQSEEIDDWSIPVAWNYTAIQSRALLSLPPSATNVYYEQSGVLWYPDQGAENIYLEDMGVDDSTGAGGADVATLTFPASLDPFALESTKLRSGALALTDGHRYVIRNPGVNSASYLTSCNGFIVIEIDPD